MAYGNEVGLVVVDIVQKTVLLNMCTPNLYGSSDPYQRVPRSPKRTSDNQDDRCRSPSADQVQPLSLIDCERKCCLGKSFDISDCFFHLNDLLFLLM